MILSFTFSPVSDASDLFSDRLVPLLLFPDPHAVSVIAKTVAAAILAKRFHVTILFISPKISVFLHFHLIKPIR
ncbi:hypothetical protein D3C78_1382870 [compost metagenome]